MHVTEKFFVVILVFALGAAGLWVWNAYKFSSCDFEAPYKCEAIHGVGLIPPAHLITVWFDSDA